MAKAGMGLVGADQELVVKFVSTLVEQHRKAG